MRQCRAALTQMLGALRHQVMHGLGRSLVQQHCRHRATHVAQPDKTDPFAHAVLSPDRQCP
jgi:hypothetical protein